MGALAMSHWSGATGLPAVFMFFSFQHRIFELKQDWVRQKAGWPPDGLITDQPCGVMHCSGDASLLESTGVTPEGKVMKAACCTAQAMPKQWQEVGACCFARV